MKFNFYLCLFIVLFASCKKTPFDAKSKVTYYDISEGMKEYFSFQKGSYWIYQGDSTITQDSTYVKDYFHTTEDHGYSGMTREIIVLYFSSQFLSDLEIGYFCPGQNCLLIGGAVEYFPGWAENTKIVSQECMQGCVFSYRNIFSDTINNVVYQNIIYSKILSIDSSITNPRYFLREFYFSKNIGIIKYHEINKYSNINRSYSLLRHNVIQ